MFALVCLVAACGADKTAPTDPTTTPTPRQAAPVLARFQRNGGLVATLDVVTLRTDGTARLDKRYGGAGRRIIDFRLRASTLERIRARLAKLPRRVHAAGTARPQSQTYILTYRGRAYAAAAGTVPRELRRAFTALNRVIDGSGRAP